MKAYTDIEQSKILKDILPLESADMHYSKDFDGSWFVDLAEYASVEIPKYVGNVEEHLLPCWSLSALLEHLRKIDLFPDIIDSVDCVLMDISIADDEDGKVLHPIQCLRVEGKTILDTCYEMIVKLHELKML